MADNEDRYETVDFIVKARTDGTTWFDVIFDLITANCEGDPESEENTCTCGLESMGGSSGTLDQCYRHIGIADDLVGPVNKDDLLLILNTLNPNELNHSPEVIEAYKRLYKECTWWDETLERWANEEEEDGEEE